MIHIRALLMRMRVILHFGLAALGVLIAVWVASILLGSQAKFLVRDNELGFWVPASGTSVLRLTEGGACSEFGEHGLNRYVSLSGGKKKRFLLHGDSHIEAFQVPDESKPDAVLTRHLEGKAVAFGTGQSGYGFASMIVRAKEYERVMGPPVAHVFFTAMGLEDDLFGDGMDEALRVTGGFVRKERKIGRLDLSFRAVANKAFLNFLIWRPKIASLKLIPKWSQAYPTPRRKHSATEMKTELSFILDDIKNNLLAPSVVVYGRRIPIMSKGRVEFKIDGDDWESMLLKRLAEERGISFLDVRSAGVNLYKQRGLFPNGFVNSSGPGRGHLNVNGIDAEFCAVATFLKERYGL